MPVLLFRFLRADASRVQAACALPAGESRLFEALESDECYLY